MLARCWNRGPDALPPSPRRPEATAAVPTGFLTGDQARRYGRFADEPTPNQLARHFHLDDADHAFVAEHRGEHNRLGVAIQLGSVRLLGAFLDDPAEAPTSAVRYAADQLAIERCAEAIAAYAASEGRWRHGLRIRQRYGYRRFADSGVAFRLHRFLYALCWTGDLSPAGAVRPRDSLAHRRQGAAAGPVRPRTRRRPSARACRRSPVPAAHGQADARAAHASGRARRGVGGRALEPARPAARRPLHPKWARDRSRGQKAGGDPRHRLRPPRDRPAAAGQGDCARSLRLGCPGTGGGATARRSSRGDVAGLCAHVGSLGHRRRDRSVRRGVHCDVRRGFGRSEGSTAPIPARPRCRGARGCAMPAC